MLTVLLDRLAYSTLNTEIKEAETNTLYLIKFGLKNNAKLFWRRYAWKMFSFTYMENFLNTFFQNSQHVDNTCSPGVVGYRRNKNVFFCKRKCESP